jgi:hypothetical protein
MKHGTVYGYVRGKCRCIDCTTVARSYWREVKRREYVPKPKAQVEFQPRVSFESPEDRSTLKISPGEMRSRIVSDVGGSAVVASLVVHTLGVALGDTVEITYGADEIVIRRAPLTSPTHPVP